MGKWKHRLSNISKTKKVAICSTCGPTRVSAPPCGNVICLESIAERRRKRKGNKYLVKGRRIKVQVPILFENIDRKLLGNLTGRDRNREIVRIRDKHRCQDCNKKWEVGQRRFDVHHLEGLCGKKSQGYDRINSLHILITLCHKCHYNHHQFSRVYTQGKQIGKIVVL